MIRTAGQMNIERLIDREPRIDMVGDLQRVTFCVCEGEFAARVAGAGDQAGANSAGGAG